MSGRYVRCQDDSAYRRRCLCRPGGQGTLLNNWNNLFRLIL